MKIALSMEMTLKLRDTWHAALNHEWYAIFASHEIVPLSCHSALPNTDEFDLIVLAGGNDMPDIKTWRDNNYPARDEYERRLIQQCQLTRTPVLGVCRGFHFMNWVLGGTHSLTRPTTAHQFNYQHLKWCVTTVFKLPHWRQALK